jgi:hypothetical protein
MTYLLIKRTSYDSKIFTDTFSVVEQSQDVNEIKKKKDAHEVLKKDDEQFNIVMFETINEPRSVVQDQDFNYSQLELPFPEVQ